MEPKFNTSFIPKKSLQDVGGNANGRYVGRRDVYGPGFFLSLLVFLIAVVSTIGLFAYSRIIENSIEEKIVLLESKKSVFSSEEIVELIRKDIQIKNAKKLVQEHVTLSELFNHLEQITLKRVQYTGLSFEGLPNETGLVTLEGKAKNFQDVALQTEQYRLDSNLRNPIVRELERSEEEENVNFAIEVLTNIELLSFSSMIKRSGAPASEVPQAAEGTQIPNNAVQGVPATMENIPLNPNATTGGQGAIEIENNAVNTTADQNPAINVNDTGAFVNTF